MDKEQIVQCVENSIKELIQVFCESPYFFYTENDIHCFLYQLIYKNMKGKGNWYIIKNGEKKDTLPVHKEYPTIKYYKKNIKPTRMHFDIVVFNDGYIDFEFKKSKTSNSDPTEPFIAIQIGLDTDLEHLKEDWKSLNEPINCVEFKYLLHLDRKSHKKKTIEAIEAEVNKYKDEIISKTENGGICYIDVSDPSNSKIFASGKLNGKV